MFNDRKPTHTHTSRFQLGKQSKPHHQRQSHIFVGRPKIKTESRTKGINKTPKERSKS
jgi:hypothetical protein